jgi:uncharacterized protein YndB with AHSA1/START domain
MHENRTVVTAARDVSASPERVFAFLSDLHNHWRLEDHFAELQVLGSDGGRVRMRGPLGLARTVSTVVEEAVPNTRLRGRADVGRKTVGRVAWDIEPAGGGSRITLSADVERASVLDRLLLAAGGRAYLRRIFARTLANLERELQG